MGLIMPSSLEGPRKASHEALQGASPRPTPSPTSPRNASGYVWLYANPPKRHREQEAIHIPFFNVGAFIRKSCGGMYCRFEQVSIGYSTTASEDLIIHAPNERANHVGCYTRGRDCGEGQLAPDTSVALFQIHYRGKDFALLYVLQESGRTSLNRILDTCQANYVSLDAGACPTRASIQLFLLHF
jgi:hypothetical protein